MRRLTLVLALIALPAAAKVKRPHLPARAQARAPELRLAPQVLAAQKAPLKPGPSLKVEPPAERVLDGLTLVELDPGSEEPRRIVLKPDFRGGPGAAFSVKF